MDNENTLDKGMIHFLGGTEQNSMRFHRTSQNGEEFRAYKLFTLEFSI